MVSQFACPLVHVLIPLNIVGRRKEYMKEKEYMKDNRGYKNEDDMKKYVDEGNACLTIQCAYWVKIITQE